MPDASLTPGTEASDKIWRLTHLYKIRTKDRRLTAFRPNRIQVAILKSVLDCRPIRRFYLKARQVGISTLWLLWWLDDTLFTPNTQTGILSCARENLGHLLSIIRTAYLNMPEEFREPLGNDNSQEMVFPRINSRLFCSLSIRSTGLHNLHVSEWAFCEEKNITATLAACDMKNTNITGETTGNGIGNDAYELFERSKEVPDADGFRSFFFPWFFHADYSMPEYGQSPDLTADERKLVKAAHVEHGLTMTFGQILWRRAMTAKLRDTFPQEYPETSNDAFLMSGRKFFDPRKVATLMREARAWAKDKEAGPFKTSEDEVYFEKPDRSCLYVMGADTSEGAGDPSFIKVINVTMKREAYRYRARVQPDTFYRTCARVGMEFNRALLAVERNNHGHAVLLGLQQDSHYPNLYQQEVQNRIISPVQRKIKFGWETTGNSKFLMCDQLRMAIEGDSSDDADHFEPEITFYDTVTLDECLTFVQDGDTLGAISGKHDDGIIATAIAYQMYLKLRRFIGKDGGFTQTILSGGQTTFT